MPDSHKVFAILNTYPVLMLGHIVNGHVKVSHGNHNVFVMMIIVLEPMKHFCMTTHTSVLLCWL